MSIFNALHNAYSYEDAFRAKDCTSQKMQSAIREWFRLYYQREAKKGPGSVAYGIKWLQALRAIVIDPERCPETAKEFSEYEYERDVKTGEVLEGYPDAANHSIDAARYALEPVWKRRGQ